MSKARGGSTRSYTPSIGLIVPLNKLPSSSENYGIGIVWISSAISIVDAPNKSNGEIGSD